MFLTSNITSTNILFQILEFIENHGISVGVFSSLIVGSCWFNKYLEQKRAEAFFGFYSRLSLQLHSLRLRLEKNNQLNITNSQNGNIFSLMYLEDIRTDICNDYIKPRDEELKLIQAEATEIMKTLLQTENNVHPKGICRKDWLDYQKTLFSFCFFICNKECWNTTNKKIDNDNKIKHVNECQKLLSAIDAIQTAIDEAVC